MSEDVLSERDHIDRAIEGRTLCHLLVANADEHPTEPALSWEEGQGWKTMDWRQYREAVAAA
ncbi:MAG TPA: long-chain fatty acid--CoA ligase, partial [Actinomycetota bacterium]|nr:long-chain fatty acid--CoA ligase [Actinomycetota bacterium]